MLLVTIALLLGLRITRNGGSREASARNRPLSVSRLARSTALWVARRSAVGARRREGRLVVVVVVLAVGSVVLLGLAAVGLAEISMVLAAALVVVVDIAASWSNSKRWCRWSELGRSCCLVVQPRKRIASGAQRDSEFEAKRVWLEAGIGYRLRPRVVSDA